MNLLKTNFLFIAFALLTLTSCGQKQMKENNDLSQSKAAKSKEEWKKQLTADEYRILFEKGTEAPFSGDLLENKEEGTYTCAACGSALFTDKMKFKSGTGWPSFDNEIGGNSVLEINDGSHGMTRTEIVCANCTGHLGHVFNDGPTETGLRYCVNSLSLNFVPENNVSADNKYDTLTFGGGCFWCVEAIYEMLEGVVSAESGYAGGTVDNPTYREVTTGKTGHAEVIQIVFDTEKTSVYDIFEVFFSTHDPTTLNKQGADVGTQYRSAIFYRNEQQKEEATKIIKELTENKIYDKPITTEVSAFTKFYKAEKYHQDYYSNNKNQPYCKAVIQPKIEKFNKLFKDKKK